MHNGEKTKRAVTFRPSSLTSLRDAGRATDHNYRLAGTVLPYARSIAKSSRRRDIGLHLLSRLEAENAHLRRQAVDLALKIQELGGRAIR